MNVKQFLLKGPSILMEKKHRPHPYSTIYLSQEVSVSINQRIEKILLFKF